MTSPPSQKDARVLIWDGCLNVRDLGGLPTDSGVTAFRAILRADSVRKLTDAGWEALVSYGVSRIVDLRVDSELAADPPREIDVDVVHVAVVPEFDSPDWAEVDAIAERAPDALHHHRIVYLEMLERYRANFATAIGAVAGAPAGPVLVHCMGGKDRTGLVAALALRLAGVAIPDVAADYALSGVHLAPELSEWVKRAASEDERRQREWLSQTPAAAMAGVLEEIELRYGSARAYLEAGGAEPSALDRIRERLRG